MLLQGVEAPNIFRVKLPRRAGLPNGLPDLANSGRVPALAVGIVAVAQQRAIEFVASGNLDQ